jgi:hypothetical protein
MPTIWGLGPGYYISSENRGPRPFPRETCPAAWLWQPRGSADNDNFRDL